MKGVQILILTLVLLSCNKFEHSDVDYSPSCTLCSYASSIEGTYRGEIEYFNISFPTYFDSVTMTVQQIFLGNNAINDSTIMFFATTQVYDTIGTGVVFYDTIEIHSMNGKVENYYNQPIVQEYWIRNDTIRFVNGFNGMAGFVEKKNMTLLKQ